MNETVIFNAAAIALCLLLGTTVSAWQAVRATTAEAQATGNEQKAVANEAQAKQAAAAEAQQRQRAEANEQKANTRRDEAEKQRDEIKTLNEQIQRALYAANMNVARIAWDEGNTRRVNELLGQHIPKPGESDLRGFEWHYLNRLCHSEVFTLNAHPGFRGMSCNVAFSPDSKRFVSAASDSTPKMWDAETGRELFAVQHRGSGTSVAFSPDGRQFATGNDLWDDTKKKSVGVVKVWDAQNGRETLMLDGHSDGITCVRFSSDGNYLATSSYDNTVKTWKLSSGQCEVTFAGHKSTVWNFAFHPDGSRLASAAGEVKVWDAKTGEELIILKDGGGRVAFSPDGRRLASSGKVWDSSNGKELLSLNPNLVAKGFSPDGKQLFCTSRTVVKLCDAETGSELRSFKGSSALLSGLSVSADGKKLVTASQDGVVKLWDTSSTQGPQKFGSGISNARSVTFSPDDPDICLSGWLGRSPATAWLAMLGPARQAGPTGCARNCRWCRRRRCC